MNINNEYDYLIHLLSCGLNKTAPEEIPPHLSFEKVFYFASEHEVANIVYPIVTKLQNKPSEELLSMWKEAFFHSVRRDAEQTSIRQEILNAFHSEKIYTLEVQGTVVKGFYPQRHMRMMSDMDFIIPKESLEKAGEIMQKLGFETKMKHGVEIDAERGNTEVELHTDFFDTESIMYPVLNNPYSYADLNDDFSATVSDTVFYLFHLLHTVKHCIQWGCGLRRVVDLFYVENALKDKVDMEYIDNILKQHGYYEQKVKLFAVRDKWFCGKESNEDISELEDEIKFSGNHGNDNLFYKHKFEREKAKGKHFVRLRHFLSLVFLPKEDCYKAFPFCEKHHYPIVFCWIHRFSCIVFNPKRWARIKISFRQIKKPNN